jgi:hypothetical protein
VYVTDPQHLFPTKSVLKRIADSKRLVLGINVDEVSPNVERNIPVLLETLRKNLPLAPILSLATPRIPVSSSLSASKEAIVSGIPEARSFFNNAVHNMHEIEKRSRLTTCLAAVSAAAEKVNQDQICLEEYKSVFHENVVQSIVRETDQLVESFHRSDLHALDTTFAQIRNQVADLARLDYGCLLRYSSYQRGCDKSILQNAIVVNQYAEGEARMAFCLGKATESIRRVLHNVQRACSPAPKSAQECPSIQTLASRIQALVLQHTKTYTIDPFALSNVVWTLRDCPILSEKLMQQQEKLGNKVSQLLGLNTLSVGSAITAVFHDILPVIPTCLGVTMFAALSAVLVQRNWKDYRHELLHQVDNSHDRMRRALSQKFALVVAEGLTQPLAAVGEVFDQGVAEAQSQHHQILESCTQLKTELKQLLDETK